MLHLYFAAFGAVAAANIIAVIAIVPIAHAMLSLLGS
jgi:hypothetical protein